MAIVLALVTAVTYGVADFCGGLASKRATVIQVVAGANVVGGLGVLAVAPFLADRWDTGDALLGVMGGLGGLVGVILLYRRLAAGPMSVVAPLTGVTSAVVPATWGVATGERLAGVGWVGLGVGLVAVVLVSLVSDDGAAGAQPVTMQVVVESLAAGVGFGTFFVFLDATSTGTAPWPVASARVVTSVLMIAAVIVVARRAGPDGGPVMPRSGRVLALIAAAGLADTTANVSFLMATQRGQLAVVSVLSSLYPVATVVLARLVLAERMTRPQGLGLGAAMAATVLLALG